MERLCSGVRLQRFFHGHIPHPRLLALHPPNLDLSAIRQMQRLDRLR